MLRYQILCSNLQIMMRVHNQVCVNTLALILLDHISAAAGMAYILNPD